MRLTNDQFSQDCCVMGLSLTLLKMRRYCALSTNESSFDETYGRQIAFTPRTNVRVRK